MSLEQREYSVLVASAIVKKTEKTDGGKAE